MHEPGDLTAPGEGKAVMYRSDKSEGPTAGTETVDPLPFLAGVAAAALFSFDAMGAATIVTGGFFAPNIVEGNLVTPTLQGRTMPLNPVSILVGLLFWSWLWGITGALLAVPVTVTVKIICDHVSGLKSLGTLLDN